MDGDDDKQQKWLVKFFFEMADRRFQKKKKNQTHKHTYITQQFIELSHDRNQI